MPLHFFTSLFQTWMFSGCFQQYIAFAIYQEMLATTSDSLESRGRNLFLFGIMYSL